jgi:hypothetical protein
MVWVYKKLSIKSYFQNKEVEQKDWDEAHVECANLILNLCNQNVFPFKFNKYSLHCILRYEY